jgi:hypothetical protein
VVIKVRKDLMSAEFPSIWLEVLDKHKSGTIVGGFYRQWSSNGIRSTELQVREIELFCNQINKAAVANDRIIVTGDANLCSSNWQKVDYDKKVIANPLIQCLNRNGLDIQNAGFTYQADRVGASGLIIQSALDHVYTSSSIGGEVKINKLSNSSRDHLPVVTSYSIDKAKTIYKRSITKRSFKNFTTAGWIASLARQDWSEVEHCDSVEAMVTEFQENVMAALDQIAPIKMFKVRSKHKFGLSESTKELMKKGTT